MSKSASGSMSMAKGDAELLASPGGQLVVSLYRDMCTPRAVTFGSLGGSTPDAGAASNTTSTSVMGSLVEVGIKNSISSPEKYPTLAKLTRDSFGRDLSEAEMSSLAAEVAHATEAQTGTQMSGLGDPALMQRMADTVLAAQARTLDNPMLSRMETAISDNADLCKIVNECAIQFATAKIRHVKAGQTLGSRQAIEDEIDDLDSSDPDHAANLANAKIRMDKLPKLEECDKKLTAATRYKNHREDLLWESMVEGNIREDKSEAKLMTFPTTIDPEDRKNILATMVAWTQKASVVKKFSVIIPQIRAMATIMNPIDGKYQRPDKTPDPKIREMYESLDLALAEMIKHEVHAVEITTLWEGSANIGTANYVELYPVNPRSGLDMMYAFVSQYMNIQVGSSRLEVQNSLSGIAKLFKGPAPIESNAIAIREMISKCVEAGVRPAWLPHGINCVRAVVNRGIPYSNAMDKHNLKEGCEWSQHPKDKDITRMLYNLINITKGVDNTEQFNEQEDEAVGEKRKTKDRTAAMEVDVEAKTITKQLKRKLHKAQASDAANVSVESYEAYQSLVHESNPKANLENKSWQGKIVAADILLQAGKTLTLGRVTSAATQLGKGKSKGGSKGKGKGKGKSKGGKAKGSVTKECNAKDCNKTVDYEYHKFCYQHAKKLREGTEVTTKQGDKGSLYKASTDAISSSQSAQTMSITVADENHKCTTHTVDANTVKVLQSIKDSNLTCVTKERADELSAANVQAAVARLINP